MNGRQYNFVSMAGERVGKIRVLREAPSENGNARWFCRCECGKEIYLTGIVLRAAKKRNSVDYSCPACRKKRPDTVARKNADLR